MTVEKLITDHIDIWTSALQTRSTAGRGSNGKIDLYGIKKLRELILELAVRGKLVPQDSNDEPASELLKRIAAEKAELVKQGKIKKQKPLPDISEDEKPFELPKGWEWVRLGEVAEIIRGVTYGKTQSSEVEKKGMIPLLRANNIQSKILIEPLVYVDEKLVSAEQHLHAGDILIAMSSGSESLVGKAAQFFEKGDYTFGAFCGVVRAYSKKINDFIGFFLKTPLYREQTKASGKGIGIKNLNKSNLEMLLIALPSKKNIAQLLEKTTFLLTLCDQLEQQSLSSLDAHQQLVETLLSTLTDSQNAKELAENWARISQHFDTLFTTEASIDALKQTILQLAVMGKLVPQDPNDEPASELLKRIEQEKAQLVKEGKIKKHPPVEPLGEPALLPRSWLNIVVQDFADIRLGSTPDRSEKKYWNGDIPWVSSGEVANEVILDTKEKITSEGFKNTSTSMIPTGSLLMAIIGQGKTRGQTAILGIDACTNQNVAAFVFNQVFVEPEYVWIWAKSKYLSHRGDGHGGAQPALNGKKVRSFIFPLAPIKEQQRIVSEVKRFNDICDTLKSRLQSAQQSQLYLADALTDAALN